MREVEKDLEKYEYYKNRLESFGAEKGFWSGTYTLRTGYSMCSVDLFDFWEAKATIRAVYGRNGEDFICKDLTKSFKDFTNPTNVELIQFEKEFGEKYCLPMKFDVQDLEDKGLVTIKEQRGGLKVIKYKNKVFYDNLWHLDERLLHCRGTVVDKDWNVVAFPFKKVFNYQENGVEIDLNRRVDLIHKMNGFMMAVSWHKGELLFSTTGSLESDYVNLGRDAILGSTLINYNDLKCNRDTKALTLLFEVCHPSDPHIINEEQGACLIGAVDFSNEYNLLTEDELDEIADIICAKRPQQALNNIKFSAALDLLKDVKHEGFMIRDSQTKETLCKLKSPYYLTKKFFMRVSKNRLKKLFEDKESLRKTIDEEYYPLLDFITENFSKDSWEMLDEVSRGNVVENILKRGNKLTVKGVWNKFLTTFS